MQNMISFNNQFIIDLKIMQQGGFLVDYYPQNQIQREDDHMLRKSAYFQIHSKNFQITHYDHGTKQLRERYQISKKIYKYFNKRNFLFSKFEHGISIDQQSWYSVIPEPVSLYLLSRLKSKNIKKIFQPFCGIGGISIHLSNNFKEYIVNDIDKDKIKMLKHNLIVYNKSVSKLKYFNEDFLNIQPFETQTIIICPPWGGIDTIQYASEDLDAIMSPKLSQILIHAQKFSSQIILQLPNKTNIPNLISIIHKVGIRPIFTIQKIQTNNRCSQIFVYFGNQNFINIKMYNLNTKLNQDCRTERKIDKKKIKQFLKQKSLILFDELYRLKFPNKHFDPYLLNNFNCIIPIMSEIGLDPKIIYAYDTHRNIPWNIVQYQPLKNYEDPLRAITERKIQQGSFTYNRYATKKGSFLDQHIKNVKDLPAPCNYDSKSEFDQTLNKRESQKHKIDLKLRKNSYLQQIERHAKLFKPPGVGAYHIQSPSASKSKIKRDQKSQRHFFYEDSQFLSTAVPGSGCYYPHDQIPNIKKQRKTHKDWIKKHSQQKDRDRKRKLKQPDPGTYIPLYASFNSFEKIKVDNQKRKKKVGNKKTSHGFGSSDSKFTYERPKKGSKQTRPDPCNYNTAIDWKGKGADAKKNNWVRCLSAGPTRSLYH